MLRNALLAFTVVSVAGCKAAPTPTTDQLGATPKINRAILPPVFNPATVGSISGVVDFKGKAPARIPIDMSADPACALSKDPNLTQQIIVTDHKLANVYIFVKSGIPDSNAPGGSAPVVLDQKGCRYVPHVIAVQQGGTVEFKNSDPTMHNVHTMPTQAGNKSIDLSESPMGAPQYETFKSPEVMLPVRCNNHPWMSAFINVAPNPYFTVTGQNGVFKISNLPAGTYTIAAVQEKLGEKDIQVKVAAKSDAKASFTFSAK